VPEGSPMSPEGSCGLRGSENVVVAVLPKDEHVIYVMKARCRVDRA
jgi:hypothetical protein